jgi:hypothetical protein
MKQHKTIITKSQEFYSYRYCSIQELFNHEQQAALVIKHGRLHKQNLIIAESKYERQVRFEHFSRSQQSEALNAYYVKEKLVTLIVISPWPEELEYVYYSWVDMERTQ